jgi:formiminotetrahydrofolate cyclodeaminase
MDCQLWRATVLVETSSTGATEPFSPRGVGGSCLVDRPVTGIDAYLDELASAAPTPGGGSAAMLVAACGAALCAMVARITAGSPKHAAGRAAAEALAADADALRERLGAARVVDEAAFGEVVAAQALPRGSEGEKAARTRAVQAALVRAAEAPLAAAGLCAEGIVLVERAVALDNPHLISDVECALHFLRAAQAACVANVRINHRYIRDAAIVQAQDARLTALITSAHACADRVLAALA